LLIGLSFALAARPGNKKPTAVASRGLVKFNNLTTDSDFAAYYNYDQVVNCCGHDFLITGYFHQ
jgi:hypothetical protein